MLVLAALENLVQSCFFFVRDTPCLSCNASLIPYQASLCLFTFALLFFLLLPGSCLNLALISELFVNMIRSFARLAGATARRVREGLYAARLVFCT